MSLGSIDITHHALYVHFLLNHAPFALQRLPTATSLSERA